MAARAFSLLGDDDLAWMKPAWLLEEEEAAKPPPAAEEDGSEPVRW